MIGDHMQQESAFNGCSQIVYHQHYWASGQLGADPIDYDRLAAAIVKLLPPCRCKTKTAK